MSDYERLIPVLKNVFLKRGLYKRADWAKYLGYNSAYLSGVLNGKEQLTDSFLKKISDEFGINPDWVKTGNGSVFIENDNINSSTSSSDGSISIPSDVWEVIRMQAASLERKDAQIDRVIDLLERQLSNDKKNSVKEESGARAEIV